MARSINRFNKCYITVSQLFAELPVAVGLVYDDSNRKKEGNLITLKLKVSKRRVIEITKVDGSSLHVMVSEKGEYPYPSNRERIISYEAVKLQEGDIFDLESYLQAKGYQFSQLTSGTFSRRKNNLNRYCLVMGKCGIIEGSCSWMDIEVYDIDVLFLPCCGMFGKREIVSMYMESYMKEAYDLMKKTISKKQRFDEKSFYDYVQGASVATKLYLRFAGGEVRMDLGFADVNIDISFEFSDGRYHIYLKNWNLEDPLLFKFVYEITQADSKEKCQDLENKMRMLGMI